jgi:hypothetical protein
MLHARNWLSVTIAPFFLISCITDNESRPEEKFGLIDENGAKNWSALWHMNQTGTIEFCIRNQRNQSDRLSVQDAARYSVDSWVDLLSKNPPDSSYPSWKRARVTTTFGCSVSSYRIDLVNGRSNCPYSEKRINLGYDTPWQVLAHEFGHSMGLADTYSYTNNGGALPGQPDSMMQGATRFTDDDYHAIWSLWNFITTGRVRCGPGYTPSRDYNGWGNAMCEPGRGEDPQHCQHGTCSSEGYCENGWRCTDGCWERVERCRRTANTCENGACSGEGRCERGWLCRDGCWDYVGGCGSSSCDYRCSDFNYREGQCYNNWRCRNGCLQYGC